MAQVSIRELRNNGGEVVDRVMRGERLTVTRSGKPVAELNPLQPSPLPAAQLVSRWRRLPALDPARLRGDLDRHLDPSL